jgi:NADH dehydrogenase
MSLRRVTIIGASGFVGRYVVRRVAKTGATIAAVSRGACSAGYLRPMGDVGQIALIDADLRDETLMAAAIAGSDAVVNATGIVAERGRQTFAAIHHQAPARLAALAKEAGVRQFVHLSAIGADPRSPGAYGRSKAAGEAAVRQAFPEAVILRPSIIFGPEDHFFNRFAAMARTAPGLPLVGGGATKFQPVYVGDVADAVVAALQQPEAAGKTYELTGPQIYSFRELMEMILADTGRYRGLVDIPFPVASILAAFLQWLPGPPLTPDQVQMLKVDNLPAPGAPGLADLGVSPTALPLVLPTVLDRYRRAGVLRTA